MIPPALWVFAATWACQMAILTFGFVRSAYEIESIARVAAGAWVASSSIVCWQLVRRRSRSTSVWAVALAVAMAGTAASAASSARQARCMIDLGTHAMSSFEFVVGSDPSVTDTGFRYRVSAIRGGEASGDVWLIAKDRLERGDHIACVGRYRPLGDDDYGRSGWAQGICGNVLAVRVLRVTHPRRLQDNVFAQRDRVIRAIDAQACEERALLAGCVCGSREALVSFGIDQDFSACGMAHIIAVSGAHLTVAASLLAKQLERLRCSVRIRLLLLSACAGLYVLFCGAPISACRSWLMMLAAFGSQVAGRRSHALSGVCVVATLIVLVDPQAAGQMGFQLSVLSVMGLCLLSPYAHYLLQVLLPNPRLPRSVGHRVRRAAHAVLDALRQTLSATIVCQLVTLPVTAPAFGRVSLVAPVANLLVAPLVPPLIACGLVACVASSIPALLSAALVPCDVLCGMMLGLAHRLSALPHATISAGVSPLWIMALALVPIVCLVWWPRIRREHALRILGCISMVLALVLVRWRFLVPARVVVLDVGQGDAILVQDGASAVLIDAGPDESVVAALARWHVLHLDAIVVTHLHDDHYGGIEHLRGAVLCDDVIVARGVREAMGDEMLAWCHELSGRGPTEIGYEDILEVGGYRLRMVWPRSVVDGSENAHSIELLAAYDTGGRTLTALLTGDAECDETGACVSAGDVGDIDLLKVGHHGSEVSITSEEALVLDPEVSVASAGEGNRYGHPTRACIEVLEGVGSDFLCTKDVGDVEIRPGREGPVVSTQRREPHER